MELIFFTLAASLVGMVHVQSMVAVKMLMLISTIIKKNVLKQNVLTRNPVHHLFLGNLINLKTLEIAMATLHQLPVIPLKWPHH